MLPLLERCPHSQALHCCDTYVHLCDLRSISRHLYRVSFRSAATQTGSHLFPGAFSCAVSVTSREISLKRRSAPKKSSDSLIWINSPRFATCTNWAAYEISSYPQPNLRGQILTRAVERAREAVSAFSTRQAVSLCHQAAKVSVFLWVCY